MLGHISSFPYSSLLLLSVLCSWAISYSYFWIIFICTLKKRLTGIYQEHSVAPSSQHSDDEAEVTSLSPAHTAKVENNVLHYWPCLNPGSGLSERTAEPRKAMTQNEHLNSYKVSWTPTHSMISKWVALTTMARSLRTERTAGCAIRATTEFKPLNSSFLDCKSGLM